VTQEALLRLTRQQAPIDEPAAWITTVVTRLSINVLRSALARRESYVGPWLPEPLVEDPAPGPASRDELADSLSLAMPVLLERLTPVERAAYLLREVFEYALTGSRVAAYDRQPDGCLFRSRRCLQGAGRSEPAATARQPERT
jgi:RNA polymerase sigma-70 factor (ECF subfamily)